MIRSALFIAFIFLSFLASANEGTEVEVCRNYQKSSWGSNDLDSIEKHWNVQEVPKSCRASFLIALSAYPELRSVPIQFRKADLKTTMAAQPLPGSLFGPERGRAYRILIDTLDPASEGKLFEALPFDARIGIMAHELAHILDYTQRDIGGMFRYGARYLFEEGKKELEARTDRIAVERGFGWQLLAFKEHIRKEAELSPSYRSYKEKIYLSHMDLRNMLDAHPAYASSPSAQL